MRFDFFKVFALVGVAMAAVEKIKSATGPQKEAAVLAAIEEALPQVEGVLGVDFANDAELKALFVEYIIARKALVKALAHARAVPNPTTPAS